MPEQLHFLIAKVLILKLILDLSRSWQTQRIAICSSDLTTGNNITSSSLLRNVPDGFCGLSIPPLDPVQYSTYRLGKALQVQRQYMEKPLAMKPASEATQ
jgi:hypothetical protein